MSNIFERASRKKLTFSTHKGTLSVGDLWDLPLSDLDAIAKNFNKAIKESSEESFVLESKVDPDVKLVFDIVIHVIEYKIKLGATAIKSAKKKENNEKILEIMGRKQDSELEDKSLDELKALLED